MSLTIEPNWPQWHNRLLFVDACVPKRVSPALKILGWDPIWIGAVYPNDGHGVPDIDWIEQCGRRDVPVLTRNPQIPWIVEELDTVKAYDTKLFVLQDTEMTAVQTALVVGRHYFNITNRASQPGGCCWELPPLRAPLHRWDRSSESGHASQ